MFTKEILFFICTLGWFNCLLLGLYFLFFIQRKSLHMRLLGVLMLLMSFRVGKSVVWYFNPDLPVIYIQIGLGVCFFIGPMLFLYLEAVTQGRNVLGRSRLAALGVGIALMGLLLVGYTKPEDLVLWKNYFAMSIYAFWFFSVLASGIWVWPNLKKGIRQKETVRAHEKWLLAVYFTNFVVVASYTLSVLKIFNVAYISGAITFSIAFYANALLLTHRHRLEHLFEPEPEKYQDKKLPPELAKTLAEQLATTLQQPKVYQNPDLKLADLAQEMGISSHQLSQLLNDNLQKTFASYLHEFRIAKACELLAQNTPLKTEAIGYEVGYQSKSTFFAAFKKITGRTPAAYQADLQSGKNDENHINLS